VFSEPDNTFLTGRGILPRGLQANPSKQLYPGYNEPGTTGDHQEWSQGQLLPRREFREPLHDKLQVGLDRREIDVLGIPSRHQRVVLIVWHGDTTPDGGLMSS
jgi:hypothetical protein